jgi:hypothetical protein
MPPPRSHRHKAILRLNILNGNCFLTFTPGCYAFRWSPPVYSGLHSTVPAAESHVEPFVLEQPEHGAPGLSHFCVQVRAPFSTCSRPGFLNTIQGYRPLETGHALAWVAVPMFVVVWLVAWLAIQTNSRLTLALGLTLVAVACWICSRIDSAWAGNNFEALELLLALGLAGSYVGLVSSIVLGALESGALASAANAATFSGFMHFIRLFGGQIGTATMNRIVTVRERFHDNAIGLHVQAGNWLTDERVRADLLRAAREFATGQRFQYQGRNEPVSKECDFFGFVVHRGFSPDPKRGEKGGAVPCK